MSASSEAYAYHPSEDSAVQPSDQDARFAVDATMQLTQQGEARGYGFSYLDPSGRQVTEWVFSAGYVPPPSMEATIETPTDPARSFSSWEEWKEALQETGPNAIWQAGAIFARSWVTTFQGIPSDDPRFYQRYEQWPTGPLAAVHGERFQQIDPGPVHAPAQRPDAAGAANAVTANAAMQTVAATGPTGAEVGLTDAYTVEFWPLFDNYQNPTTAQLPLMPGPPVGVPSPQSLAGFLAYWKSPSAPETAQQLAVVTSARSRTNPY